MGLYSVAWIPTPGFNQSSQGESENTPVLYVYQYSLQGLAIACQGFTACRSGFPSCCKENDSDPKSGQDLDPEKLGYAMSCREHVAFLCTFCGFCP